MKSMIERAIGWMSKGLALIGGLALVLMMLQTAAGIFMLNVFGYPIPGNLQIISVYHMVLVVFLPLAFVETRHEHINVDLFIQLLPKGVVRAILVFGYLVCAVFFALLTFQTWHDAVEAWRINEIMMGAIYVTIWPAKFALPVGFFAVMLTTLLHAWKALSDPDFDPTPAAPDTYDPA